MEQTEKHREAGEDVLKNDAKKFLFFNWIFDATEINFRFSILDVCESIQVVGDMATVWKSEGMKRYK